MEAVMFEKEALQLPDCERAVLADRLLASLSRRPAGLDDAWLREADERMAAYREGRIEALPGPVALAELRREIRQ
jgi:putative addiction module component (TIGR02574 family)